MQIYNIRQVISDKDRKSFLRFPYKLYKGDPNWIPRLWPEQLAWMRREHGFFEHADADWYILSEADRILGTIGVAIDEQSNQHLGRQDAFFGFIEFVEDYQVFQALIQSQWIRTPRTGICPAMNALHIAFERQFPDRYLREKLEFSHSASFLIQR